MAGSIYAFAVFLLQDEAKEAIHEFVDGPRGCGQHGLQAIPALLATFVATAVVVWFWRSVRKRTGPLPKIAITVAVVAVIVAVIMAIIVLVLNSGADCIE